MRVRIIFCAALTGLFLLGASFTLSAQHKFYAEVGGYAEIRYFRTMPYYHGDALKPLGVQLFLNIGKRLSLDYQIGGTRYVNSVYGNMHVPAGMGYGSFLLRDRKLYGAFLFLIPEGVGYYFKEDHSGVHVSVRPIGMEYFHKLKSEQETYEQTASLSIRYRYVAGTKGLAASAYVTPFTYWNDPGFRVAVGVMISYTFLRKSDTNE
jgi:hypothetical protein